jgi:ribosome-associated translation inhibitor RaiA
VVTWSLHGRPGSELHGIAALMPSSGVVFAKEVARPAQDDLAWASLLADVLDHDRDECVRGTLHVRPAVAWHNRAAGLRGDVVGVARARHNAARGRQGAGRGNRDRPAAAGRYAGACRHRACGLQREHVRADPATVPVEIHAPDELPAARRAEIRESLAGLVRATDEPIQGVRLTLRRPDTRVARSRWVADASLLLNGRPLAAHATGQGAAQAAKEAADRLLRQMRRVADAGTALRNEPRAIAKALASLAERREHRPRPRLKLPELRDVIPRRTAYPFPETTLDAVADLLDLDLEFLLFRHARTGEDVVVYRRDDGRIGLLHPPGSPLADDNHLVVPEPGRYPEPVSLERVREELDVLGEGFIYFTDERDGRGKVLYVRQDGDYGLVEPPPVVPRAS